MPDRMTRREWTGTLLGAGLVVAVACLVEAYTGSIALLAATLVGAFVLTFSIVMATRIFSNNSRPASVRLQMEVHP